MLPASPIQSDLIFFHSSPVLPGSFPVLLALASCPHLHPEFLLGSPNALPSFLHCLTLPALYPTSAPSSIPQCSCIPPSPSQFPYRPSQYHLRPSRSPPVSQAPLSSFHYSAPPLSVVSESGDDSADSGRFWSCFGTQHPPAVYPSMSQCIPVCLITSQYPSPTSTSPVHHHTDTHRQSTAQ